MAKFSVDVPHALPAAEVHTRLEQARGKLEQEYGATCKFEGPDLMRVQRKGLDAQVHILPDKLKVDVELGFFMSPMAGMLRENIVKKLSSLLS